MHPTMTNIHTIQFLIEEQSMSLPVNYLVVGLCHEASAFDFRLPADYQ